MSNKKATTTLLNADAIVEAEIARAKAEKEASMPTVKTTEEIYAALTADFPVEAMTKDSSRGFALTSIKAQYIVERLNQVLGFNNWTHAGEFKEVHDGVLYLGFLSIRIGNSEHRQYSPGFAKITDGKNLGDAYKSAKTDSLSKSASLMGVGNSVFKGLVDANSLGASKSAGPATARSRKAAETTTGVATAGLLTTENSTAETHTTSGTKATAAPTSFARRTKVRAVKNDDGI